VTRLIAVALLLIAVALFFGWIPGLTQ